MPPFQFLRFRIALIERRPGDRNKFCRIPAVEWQGEDASLTGDEEAPGKGVKTDETDINVSYVPVAGKPYNPPKSYFFEHGDYTSRGPEMQPEFVQVIADPNAPTSVPPADGRITTASCGA